MYCMVCTRPDLAYGISLTSRFMACPREAYWEALKWIMRYLKRTKGRGILYETISNPASMKDIWTRIMQAS